MGTQKVHESPSKQNSREVDISDPWCRLLVLQMLIFYDLLIFHFLLIGKKSEGKIFWKNRQNFCLQQENVQLAVSFIRFNINKKIRFIFEKYKAKI